MVCSKCGYGGSLLHTEDSTACKKRQQTGNSGPKFSLGQIVATPGALDTLNQDQILDLLARHSRLDQGALDDEDHKANADALVDGTRIFSSYKLASDVKIWIITEADRSVTTLLLPEEY
jgi:hypothetical protein